VSTTIQPETILRQLADLWVTLGKEVEPGPSGVLRACAMTFIAATDESEDPSDIWATIAALMPEHPSRAVVIRFRESAARELSARVFSQCWMPFGHRRQICCEQIEITASDTSLPDLPAVILPLAVADLPVILWCRGSRLFRLPEFPQLAKVAHKLVLDSAAFQDPIAILNQLASRAQSNQVLADLAWTRLTRGRELISQIFENRSYLSKLPEVTEISIAFGGSHPPTAAYYLAAWLLDCFAKVGANAKIAWQPVGDAPDGALRGVELVTRGAGGLRVSMAVASDGGGQPVEIQIDSLSNRVIFPPSNDYTSLREELSIPGRDPVFEASLSQAARLASAEAE